MPYIVAKISEADAKQLVSLGKRAFTNDIKFYSYTDNADDYLPSYEAETISEAENNSMGELTHDSIKGAWPIIRPRKMFPR